LEVVDLYRGEKLSPSEKSVTVRVWLGAEDQQSVARSRSSRGARFRALNGGGWHLRTWKTIWRAWNTANTGSNKISCLFWVWSALSRNALAFVRYPAVEKWLKETEEAWELARKNVDPFTFFVSDVDAWWICWTNRVTCPWGFFEFRKAADVLVQLRRSSLRKQACWAV